MRRSALALAIGLAVMVPVSAQDGERMRARDIGVAPGVLEPGPLNAITDVAGVLVGHSTIADGERFNTGVTAIRPHPGNLYRDKVPAAIVVGNGYGKLAGSTQVQELGEIETPILLTGTLNVPRVADALISWSLAQPGMEQVASINPVVGETNDGGLSDIRARSVGEAEVFAALDGAASGPVAEGAVGAGAGTIAFGWKGGIGTSSRKLPDSLGGHMVGVLAQSNFGGMLKVDGVDVGEALGKYYLKGALESRAADGSIMIVVATDAPLGPDALERLARRAMAGLARTGAAMTNGSGDYVIAFSTAQGVRRTPERQSGEHTITQVPGSRLSPLFAATIEATEEAILNSLFMARTTTGYSTWDDAAVTVEAIDLDAVRRVLDTAGRGQRP
ncbi:P1 family peptidase [Erythrobacter sp. NFXS35]|uniref:P1 family peptidase n=1 Tax=Erythrobacter sp. NFXS35 TaxID=2818436 RepID=UPI0032DFE38C